MTRRFVRRKCRLPTRLRLGHSIGERPAAVIDRRFKFSLVYLHSEREIHVVAIAPTKRRPGHWIKRVGDV
jgi:hypothetical protein